jgi:hypothetical protein
MTLPTIVTDRRVIYPPPFDAQLHPTGTTVRVESSRTRCWVVYVSNGACWRISVEGRS